MKKIIIFIILIVSVNNLIFSWDKLSSYDLKGPVRNVEIQKYEFQNKFGVWIPILQSVEIRYFNRNGDSIGAEKFDSNNILEEKEIYIFNNEGQFIEWDLYSSNNIIIASFIYNYVNENKIEITYKDFLSNYENKEIQIFNSNKNMTSKDQYNKLGTLDCRYIYIYDSNNKLVENISYNAENEISYKEVWERDENGFVIEHRTYNSDNTLRGKEIYKKDSLGRDIEIRNYVKESLVYYTINDYDNNNRLVSQSVYLNSGKYWFPPKIYTYEVDEYNWIKKTTSIEKDTPGGKELEPTDMIIRKIIYYD